MPLKKTGINDFEMMRPAERKDPRAEPAETAFSTVSRASHRAAWMALRPFTGRTHQLRAHMAGIGHPISWAIQNTAMRNRASCRGR
jgi:23S rRNA pseudouridine955/2504/2580 synthase